MTTTLTEHYKGLLMALACALVALSGVGPLAHNLRLALTGVHTPGVIVATKWDGCGPSGRSCAYFPVVRFRLRDGHTMEVEGTIGTDNPPEFHAGEKVTVYYDSWDPQTAVIDSWKDLWLGPLGSIVLGTVFVLLGAWKEESHQATSESHQATSESASETIIHEETGAYPAQEHDQVTSEFEAPCRGTRWQRRCPQP
jgi:hypothetical protein